MAITERLKVKGQYHTDGLEVSIGMSGLNPKWVSLSRNENNQRLFQIKFQILNQRVLKSDL